LIDDLPEDGQQVLRGLDVESRQGLVEEEHAGFAGQSPAHLDEAEDAEWQSRHRRLLHSGEPQQLQQLLHPLVLLRRKVGTTNGERACRPQSRCGATRALCASIQVLAHVSPRKSSGCWNVRANPSSPAPGRTLVTSSPCRCTRPPLGRRRPDRTARSVDFPHRSARPGPRCSPGGPRDSPRKAPVSPPKRTVMSCAERAGHLRRQRRRNLHFARSNVTRCAPRRDVVGTCPTSGKAQSTVVDVSALLPRSHMEDQLRSRRLCSARTPSGYLAAETAPSPKSTGVTFDVHVGR
jgi:hypothetical protein